MLHELKMAFWCLICSAALDDATQEFIWTHLIEDFLHSATVIIASSRPVISCTGILHLSTDGLKGVPQIVSGFLSHSHVAHSPFPRYASGGVKAAIAPASQASADAAEVGPFAATQRSRLNSIGTTVEDASVFDVSSIVTEYEEWSSRQEIDKSLPNKIQMVEMAKSTSLRASLLSPRPIKESSFLEHLEETTSSRDRSSILGNRGNRASYSMYISGFQHVDVKFGKSFYIREDSSLFTSDAPTTQATPKAGAHQAGMLVSSSRLGFVQWITAMQLGKSAILIPLTYVSYQVGLTYYWQVAFWWCQLFFGISGVMFQVVLVCTIVVMALSRISNDFLVYKTAINGAQRMRKNFCECVLNAPMIFFMTENIGPLVDVFSGDLSTVSEVLLDSFHCAIIYALIVVGSMAIAIYYYPYLSMVSLFVLAACAWLQVVYRGRLKQVSLEFQKANNEVFHCVSDLIEVVKILRTANGSRWALDLLSEVFQTARIAVVASEKCTIWLNSRSCILGLCVSWSLTLVAYYFISDPASRRVVINGSSLYIVFLQWFMKTVGLAIYSMGSVERIHDYLQRIPCERRDGHPLDTKWPKEGDIELKNLCLTYGPQLPPALDDVSFKFAPASKVGVVGRTGSGKSSLLVALFRLIQPSSGDMVVGGCSITNVRLDSLRQQMSVLPQVRARFRSQMHQPHKWPHFISLGTCHVLWHPSAECGSFSLAL